MTGINSQLRMDMMGKFCRYGAQALDLANTSNTGNTRNTGNIGNTGMLMQQLERNISLHCFEKLGTNIYYLNLAVKFKEIFSIKFGDRLNG